MKASELRIGNLVEYKNQYINVSGIGPFGIQSEGKKYLIIAKFSTPDIQPIPLTEEWLLKFGFEKIDDFDVYSNIWRINGFMVSFGDYINIHLDWADDEVGFHSIMCYEELFVHQLQNLYFALTGEELVVKE
jgi:hypothetical protein